MPRVKTTRTVRIALWVLPLYLLFMLSLICIKFVRVSTSHAKPAAEKIQAAPTPSK